MPDIVDLGNDRAQEMLDDALAKVPPPTVEPGVGLCLNCGELLADNRRWCDTVCRDDWQRAHNIP